MVLNGCLWLRATRLGSCSPVGHCQILLDVFRGHAGRQGGQQTGSESALSAGWRRGTRAFQTCTGSAKMSNINTVHHNNQYFYIILFLFGIFRCFSTSFKFWTCSKVKRQRWAEISFQIQLISSLKCSCSIGRSLCSFLAFVCKKKQNDLPIE